MTTKPCSRCGRDDVADIHTCVSNAAHRAAEACCRDAFSRTWDSELVGYPQVQNRIRNAIARHMRAYADEHEAGWRLVVTKLTDAARAVVDRHRYLEAHSSDYDDGYMGPTIDALAALVKGDKADG